MDENLEGEIDRVPSRTERAEAFAKALREAARRARLSKKNRQHLATGGYRGRGNAPFFRRIRWISFVVGVVLPSLLAAGYYGLIASAQYTAETRFTLRGGAPPKLDTIGTLTGLPPALIMQDTQVILNFILSRTLVERLDQTLGLEGIYSKPSIDMLSRMKADAPIEKKQSFWKSMVDFSVHMPAGIVVVRVRAFSREDAERVADAVLQACEGLVNDMNDRMIRDTLGTSETERQRAALSLAAARTRLETARNTEGLLSAEKAAEALNDLITKVRAQLVEMQQDYEAQRRYVAEDAPQIRNLNIRIDAANAEIKALQANLTGVGQGGVTPLTKSMSRLDYLNLENTVAEKLYASALALFEHARLASQSKLLYLNVFVRPSLADAADEAPHRSGFLIFVAGDLALWSLFVFGLRVWRRRSLFGLSFRQKSVA